MSLALGGKKCAQAFIGNKCIMAAELEKRNVKLRVPIPANVRKMAPMNLPTGDRSGKLRLDFNENTVGCAPAILNAVRKLSAEQIAMYPEYESTVRWMARWHGVRPSELTISNGADGGLRQIVDTFVESGSEALLAEPTFPMYRFYLGIAGARIRTIRYERDMSFPMDAALRELRRAPRLMFLASPNNPTGTLLDPAAIRQLIQISPRTMFVVDEAYCEFSDVTVLPWIRRYPNLAVVRTFSKAAGLAGLRLGCVLACPEVTSLLAKTFEAFAVNAAALTAAKAVAHHREAVRSYVREIHRSRKFLAEALSGFGARVFPSVANFVLADLGPTAPRIVKQLAGKGILLRPMSFGRPGFVRITIGTMPQMKRLVRALKAIW
jgi:histidinol-phosphate aminotransferase